MHDEAFAFLQAHAVEAKTVLDVGGRNINGSPRGLFKGADYTALDVAEGHGVDVVADVTEWSDRRKFDVVICAEVLEHAPNWRDIVGACFDRVKVGGLLLVTCATTGRVGHSAVDGGPLRPGEFYENVPAKALEKALEKLGADVGTVEVHGERGDLYVAATRPRAKRKSHG